MADEKQAGTVVPYSFGEGLKDSLTLKGRRHGVSARTLESMLAPIAHAALAGVVTYTIRHVSKKALNGWFNKLPSFGKGGR